MSFEEFVKYFWEFAKGQSATFFFAICLFLMIFRIPDVRRFFDMESVFQAHREFFDFAFLFSAVVSLSHVLNSAFAKSKELSERRKAAEAKEQEHHKTAEAEERKQRRIVETLSRLPSAEAAVLNTFMKHNADVMFISGDEEAAISLMNKGIIKKGARKETQEFAFLPPEYAFSLTPDHAEFIKSEWLKLHPGGVAKQRKSRAKRR